MTSGHLRFGEIDMTPSFTANAECRSSPVMEVNVMRFRRRFMSRNVVDQSAAGMIDIPGSFFLCHSCQKPESRHIRDFKITELLSESDVVWTAKGIGAKGRCPSCGAVLYSVRARLPIEFSNIPCPQCQSIEGYKFTVKCVRQSGDSFEFVASVTCQKCSAKSVFRRLTEGIRRIRGITLGPFGLNFDTSLYFIIITVAVLGGTGSLVASPPPETFPQTAASQPRY